MSHSKTKGVCYSKRITIIDFHLGISKNRGTPKSSIFIGVSTIFTIHFQVSLFLGWHPFVDSNENPCRTRKGATGAMVEIYPNRRDPGSLPEMDLWRWTPNHSEKKTKRLQLYPIGSMGLVYIYHLPTNLPWKSIHLPTIPPIFGYDKTLQSWYQSIPGTPLSFWGLNPPKEGQPSNQNKGPHLGSRYVRIETPWEVKATRIFLTNQPRSEAMAFNVSPASLLKGISSDHPPIFFLVRRCSAWEKKNTWGEIHENLRVITPQYHPTPRNKALLRDY